ncbi:hypothetical protein PF006_g3158 [Phytophthora fragariae]|uniref:Uncharacterized protein n=1 Tax=Phytophthora fragariae TaxID=53985 RepID=A0A6A3UPZ5_9STRA|nr:hypothetical protein PF006_g3158 [Phytophthora fragariae]
MQVKALVARFLRRHLVLAAFLVAASIISAIVYEMTGGGKRKAWSYDAPELNAVDLEGPDRPRNLWTDDDFECIGWRATHNCDPYGPRDEARDRACGERMPRSSGYCEVRNRTSGQKFTGGDGTAASLARDLDKFRVSCKMRRLGQYTCFMLNPRTPDSNGTPSLIVSLENTKYMHIEQHAIGFSIEGRGLFNKEEEAEVAKMEADVQTTQDEETAAIFAARERSEMQTRGIVGIVVVVALGLWLRYQWIRRCRKSRPKLETKNSSVACVEASSSHVALAVNSSSPVTSGSSTAVFSGTTFNSRRRNSSFQIDDK